MKQDRIVSEVLGEDVTLSPSDLLNQQFSRARFGGYDRQQVDDFIERVADVLEGLINQVRQLREKHDEQRRTIDEYEKMEETLRNSLLSSQNHGDHMLEVARREANVIVEEAKLKRAQAQAEAGKLPTTLARDIHLLENQRSRLRVEILAILETHRRLIDSLVPEETSSVPVGFFEVGVNPANDFPMAFAEEPVTSVLEGISNASYARAEPEADNADQEEEAIEADSLEIPEEAVEPEAGEVRNDDETR